MTSEEHTTETENLLEDGKYKIKIQSELYNLFVSPDNIKSNIDIGNCITQDIKLNNQNRGSGSERYDLVLAQNIAYGCNILRNVDCVVKATGVKYYANKTVYGKYVNIHDKNHVNGIDYVGNLTDFSGLPHPFFPGISGFVCDPLNSALTNVNFSLGSTQTVVSQAYMTPAWVNARRKLATSEVLTDPRFHGLLYPETFKPEIMEMESNKFRAIPFDMGSQFWRVDKTDRTPPLINETVFQTIQIPKIGFFQNLSSNLTMTLDEINKMEHNQFGINKRGSIYKYATFLYKKQLASHNYTYTKVAAVAGDATKPAFAYLARSLMPVIRILSCKYICVLESFGLVLFSRRTVAIECVPPRVTSRAREKRPPTHPCFSRVIA